MTNISDDYKDLEGTLADGLEDETEHAAFLERPIREYPPIMDDLPDSPPDRQEEGRCSECGRDLHGYSGPRCRYCDGTAE